MRSERNTRRGIPLVGNGGVFHIATTVDVRDRTGTESNLRVINLKSPPGKTPLLSLHKSHRSLTGGLKRGVALLIRAAIPLLLTLPLTLPPGVPGLLSKPLEARNDSSLALEWKEEQGATAYQVEIKDESGQTVINRRVESNRIDFELPPGRYTRRVGAYNKFNRISNWTHWKPLAIIRPVTPTINSLSPRAITPGKKDQEIIVEADNLMPETEVKIQTENGVIEPHRVERTADGKLKLTVDLSSAENGKYEVVLENPGKKISQESLILAPPEIINHYYSGFAPSRLIPGPPQIFRNEYASGAAWILLFAGIGAAGYNQFATANQSASSTASDPIYTLLANPELRSSLNSLFSDQTLQTYLIWDTLQSYNANKSAYKESQRNQAVIGGVAAGAYLGYLLWEYRDSWTWHSFFPGLPHWRSGDKVRSIFWAGLFTAGVAATTYQQFEVNRTVNQSLSDPIYNISTDPLLSTRFITADTLRDSTFQFLLLNSFTRHDSLDRQNKAAKKGLAIAASATALIYLGHFIDAVANQDPLNQIGVRDLSGEEWMGRPPLVATSPLHPYDFTLSTSQSF